MRVGDGLQQLRLALIARLQLGFVVVQGGAVQRPDVVRDLGLAELALRGFRRRKT
ncbi:MAG: hypothetical protein JF627_00965 [Alphaproteobacteria bacterium]|nr:hypothetical protein [Alphaproteobacteria bacterium]